MRREHGEDVETGANSNGRPPRDDRDQLPTQSQISRTKSARNLSHVADPSPGPRNIRFSLDAASAAEFDSMMRSPVVTERDHGLGLSGLRRIRQQRPPSRTPTMPPSAASSRSPTGGGLPRSVSMNMMLNMAYPPGHSSPDFSEDLTRFPSESLHSFSFAHQSEEFLHNRQNVLKRSMEIMRDRVGWTASASAASAGAAIASAQARATGDVEAQDALDLLARAHLIGAGNLPGPHTVAAGPLTGPAFVSGENPFDVQFLPRSTSPDTVDSPAPMSPTTTRDSVTDGWSVRASGGSDESKATASATATSPPSASLPSLKRTLTDTLGVAMHERLMDAMAQPFLAGQGPLPEAVVSPTASLAGSLPSLPSTLAPAVHGHTNRWVPAAQAIFTTEAKPPWTIIAANDLACLVFGVTKAEIRKVGILEVVQEERRRWLEWKLLRRNDDELPDAPLPQTSPAKPPASGLLGGRSGITAQLLSKPNSRSQPPRRLVRRARTVHGGDSDPPGARDESRHRDQSRSVLLCGDVVPIQKRNGATGSASLWVKEKKVGLIWVLEEIHEDVAIIALDEDGLVRSVRGAMVPIWGPERRPPKPGMDVGRLIPRIPRQGIDPRTGEIDFAQIARRKFFTCPNGQGVNVPCKVEQVRGKLELRVSSFPHMAGIIVLSPEDLTIKSSNAVFCGALFGHEKPDGMPIASLVPDFDKILDVLSEDDEMQLVEGMVVPEHSFRRASATLGLREGRPDAAECFLRPEGLPALHRDGSDLKVDVQMRVVKSEKHKPAAMEKERETTTATMMTATTTTEAQGQAAVDDDDLDDESDDPDDDGMAGRLRYRAAATPRTEMVFALWVTYSRHLHSRKPAGIEPDSNSSPQSGASSPPHQPSPGQTMVQTPPTVTTPDPVEPRKVQQSTASLLTKQLKDVAISAAAKLTGGSRVSISAAAAAAAADKRVSGGGTHASAASAKKMIDDFTILEDMGQGAYGQVKLARYKNTGRKVVLKYVTKRRILVDTWTRDRKLGTVPLEIHVLSYLRRPELRHVNIVEMESFFEDDVNYYIEMVPHGLPGMDLFDYIELRSNMDEDECRSIFVQVARAVHHLHTRALVVHRDIKDENVILDGEGNIKLIDFGSAAYIKSGPFDVFVGTIDYAAPEVLDGMPYGGREQDVWALGILLYTIIYKENPFYSIDEILDRDLRVPFTISEDSIELVRRMLDRDVKRRYTIEQVVGHPWCRGAMEDSKGK